MIAKNYVCSATCGCAVCTASVEEPVSCHICDERQYVNPKGQSWTTLRLTNR